MALVTVIPGTFTAPGLPTLGVKGFTDTFTRPDNTSLGLTEGMPSRPWSVWIQASTPVHGIANNSGYVARADGTGFAAATVDAQASNGTLEVTMGDMTSGVQMGAAFRGTSITEYWRFGCNGTSYYRLSKYVGGANTHLQSTTGITPAIGDVLKVVLNGPSITCYVNGAQVIQVTDTDHQGLTRHGFFNNSTAASTIRDVKFTAA